MDPAQHELALRAHIRYLLLDYARTHLTKNYQRFTNDAVSEVSTVLFDAFLGLISVQLLSDCLCFVPITDPTSLTLPEDPFDILWRTLGLPDLTPYEEKWPTDRDAIQLLRKSLSFSGKPRTDRCWDEEIECTSPFLQIPQIHLGNATRLLLVDYSTSIYYPMSPILTTRAIRGTPKPGLGVAFKLMPKSQGEALKYFKRVDPEVFEEPLRVNLEDTL
jgi:hypothetical protein